MTERRLLTVVLGEADLAAQRAHLARGAMFVPEPEPLPEPFAEIVLRVETPSGANVELTAKILQILEGRGIAIAFDDAAAAQTKLAPLLNEAPRGADSATFVFWGRNEPAAAPEREPLEAPEQDDAAKLSQQIAGMSTSQKMQLAMHGDRTARLFLLKDINKNIQVFVIQNPRITLDEVRYIAGFRQANPDVLNTIAANRDWSGNPNVVSALVRNPKTPGPTAVKLLDKLGMAEIRRLAKSTDVPRAVSIAARKKVAEP